MTAPDAIDWEALERLRQAFLDQTAGQADYWTTAQDLASYDATFARRIAWKWWLVLAQLRRLGWTPPHGSVLDWGCGTGIAAREYLDGFGTSAVSGLALWDRSALAREFAARAARERFPQLAVETSAAAQPAVLLLSHVLTELAEPDLAELLTLVGQAACVLWVEPGTHDASRRLIAIRERLLGSFRVVAPCTHQARCGLLTAANERHWCHHFADPPTSAFTDAHWARFSALTGIDLRSLPLSYLVLDRRTAPPLPEDTVRLIGRPRVYKGHALVFGCTAGGVAEKRLNKRNQPEAFRRARKDRLDTLFRWNCTGPDIDRLDPWTEAGGVRVGS